MAAPADTERFRLELEFVQCLANPGYLHRATPPAPPPPPPPPRSPPRGGLELGLTAWADLAQAKVLERPVFAEYLEYLQYWRRPEYARFIRCASPAPSAPPRPLPPPPPPGSSPFHLGTDKFCSSLLP